MLCSLHFVLSLCKRFERNIYSCIHVLHTAAISDLCTDMTTFARSFGGFCKQIANLYHVWHSRQNILIDLITVMFLGQGLCFLQGVQQTSGTVNSPVCLQEFQHNNRSLHVPDNNTVKRWPAQLLQVNCLLKFHRHLNICICRR